MHEVPEREGGRRGKRGVGRQNAEEVGLAEETGHEASIVSTFLSAGQDKKSESG